MLPSTKVDLVSSRCCEIPFLQKNPIESRDLIAASCAGVLENHVVSEVAFAELERFERSRETIDIAESEMGGHEESAEDLADLCALSSSTRKRTRTLVSSAIIPVRPCAESPRSSPRRSRPSRGSAPIRAAT